MENRGPHHPGLEEPTPTFSGAQRAAAAAVDGAGDGTLKAGDRLDRYSILGRLGAGGMGVVYAAYDPRLDRQVALKLLRRRAGAEAEHQARLLREAQALAKLNDPHVLTIYDAGTVGGQIFLAVEYVDGQDLGEWLRDEQRPMTEVLRVFTEAGRGLASAHRQGLVHRDFKPSNVMVRRSDGRALVLDFGLARSEARRQNEGSGGVARAFDEARPGDPGSTPSNLATSVHAPLDEGSSSPVPSSSVPSSSASSSTVPLRTAPLRTAPTSGASPHRVSPHEEPASPAPLPRPVPELTRAGALLGTPLFMAPEQWAGEPGIAADQFSFCASLYLALYGEMPFEKSALGGMPLDWNVKPAPEGSAVPAALRRVLLRGLSREPEERFPSMDALLRQLGHDPRRRWRLTAAVAGLALAAGVGFYVARGPSPCQGAGERIEEIWNASRQAELSQAFDETAFPGTAFEGFSGQGPASAVLRTVNDLIDNYAESWRSGYEDACLATNVRGDQSTHLMDLRIACLEGRRRELDSLLGLFIADPAGTYPRAIEAAGGLSSIGECSDTAALMAPTALPEDAALRRDIHEIRSELAENRALLATGRYQEAAAQAGELDAKSRATGYLPLRAEALVRLGKAQEALAMGSEAAATFKQAVAVSQASNHDRAGAEALTQLVRVTGHVLKEPEQGDFFVELAESSLGRLDRADDLLALLKDHTGILELERGRLQRAATLHGEALVLHEARLGADHPAVARSLIRLSTVLHDLGQFQEAAETLERALEIQRLRLGEDHPDIAASLDRLGNMVYQMGELDLAERHYVDALEILRASFGPGHVRVAATQLHLATVRSAAGRYQEALELYGEALRIFEQTYGERHANVAAAWSNIGTTHLTMGQLEEAAEAYDRALEVQRSVLGEEHPALATTYFNLGEVANELGDFAAAARWHRQALGLWRSALGEGHFLLGHGLTGLGRAQLGLAENGQAVASLEAALETWQGLGQDPAVPAWTRWLLAQAVYESDPVRAVELAENALEGYRSAASAEQEIQAEIEAWLAGR